MCIFGKIPEMTFMLFSLKEDLRLADCIIRCLGLKKQYSNNNPHTTKTTNVIDVILTASLKSSFSSEINCCVFWMAFDEVSP